MNIYQDDAAHSLLGLTLKNGWLVTNKVQPKEGATGGFFSVCYNVEKDGELAFLKALNFKAFFQMNEGSSIVSILSELTSAFQFERDLSMRCRSNRLSKVSMILDDGEEFLKGFTIPNVPYLIFKMSDGDVRSHMNFRTNVETVWKLKSLHNVAVGLTQLHGVKIGHQDLKPSNILIREFK